MTDTLCPVLQLRCTAEDFPTCEAECYDFYAEIRPTVLRVQYPDKLPDVLRAALADRFDELHQAGAYIAEPDPRIDLTREDRS